MIYILLILSLILIYKESGASPFLKTERGYKSLGTPHVYINRDGSFKICIEQECIKGKITPEPVSVKADKPSQMRVFLESYYYENIAFGEIKLLGKGFLLTYKSQGVYNEMLWMFDPYFRPEDVKVTLYDIKNLYVDGEGNLVIKTDWGTFVKSKPVAWQYKGGKRVYLKARYVVNSNSYSFKIEGFDPSLPIYVDPVIKFKSFGGSKNESAINLIMDEKGYIYTVGYTTSRDWKSVSLEERPEEVFSSWDIFVAKFDKDLNLKAVAIIGGSKEEWGRSLAVDEEGYIYLCGWTHSPDLPVTDSSYKKKDADVFVIKLDPDLKRIVHLKYISGDEYEYAYTLRYFNGHIYIAGETASPDFPTTKGVYDNTFNGGTIDIFIMKMDKDLNLIASTFLGGKEGDAPLTMDVDKDGVYVAGLTWSPDLPVTEDAFDSHYSGDYDGFIAVLDHDLKHLKALTYIGGENPDSITSLRVFNDMIIVGGKTFSPNFPTTDNVIKRAIFREGMSDGFVSIFSKDLKRLLASTLIGGSEGDEVSFIYPTDDYLALGGATASRDFPLKGDPLGKKPGNDADGFFMIIDYNLRNIYFSTLIGTETYDTTSKTVWDGRMFYVSGWSIPLSEDKDVQAFLAIVEPDLSVINSRNLLLLFFTACFWLIVLSGIFYHIRK